MLLEDKTECFVFNQQQNLRESCAGVLCLHAERSGDMVTFGPGDLAAVSNTWSSVPCCGPSLACDPLQELAWLWDSLPCKIGLPDSLADIVHYNLNIFKRMLFTLGGDSQNNYCDIPHGFC